MSHFAVIGPVFTEIALRLPRDSKSLSMIFCVCFGKTIERENDWESFEKNAAATGPGLEPNTLQMCVAAV
jgi:hypothetical protein